jgi:hypothetical protein
MTTGERLVSISALTSGTAMEHFLNINHSIDKIPVFNPIGAISSKEVFYWDKINPVNFLDLIDTFSTYAGKAGKALVVNADENGISVSEIAVISDKSYVHNQSSPGLSWAITHNLSKRPSVQIVDSLNRRIEGSVEYIDENNVLISFEVAITGKAFFN